MQERYNYDYSKAELEEALAEQRRLEKERMDEKFKEVSARYEATRAEIRDREKQLNNNYSKTEDTLVKEKGLRDKTKHSNKKTIIITSCVVLGIAVIALTVALILNLGMGKSEYTITFYNNKGIYFTNTSYSGELIHTKYQDNTIYKVEQFSGGYLSEPTPPTNSGYVFLGWYQNPECTEKFLFGHYEINSDINLYAKWGK